MSKVEKQPDRIEREPDVAVALSAEERAVLARITKQTARKRPSALRQFAKNPPLCLWWWCW
jgi:hypothetical protein